MAVSLEGVRLEKFVAEREKESRRLEISGKYALVSSAGTVLALQGFNDGYGAIEVRISSDTQQLLDNLERQLQLDINRQLGFVT